jgi:hypothetical protein
MPRPRGEPLVGRDAIGGPPSLGCPTGFVSTHVRRLQSRQPAIRRIGRSAVMGRSLPPMSLSTIVFGYGEHGDVYYRDRYETVFSRAEALGLKFVGPQFPNGRQAEPWPDELPPDSRSVPTYHPSRQTPATATRQLDFVFASRALVDSTTVRALNQVDEWGPSDHCRVVIDVDLS